MQRLLLKMTILSILTMAPIANAQCRFGSGRLETSLRDASHLNDAQMEAWLSEKKVQLKEDSVQICERACGQKVRSFEADGVKESILTNPICGWRGSCIYRTELEVTAQFSCEL